MDVVNNAIEALAAQVMGRGLGEKERVRTAEASEQKEMGVG